MSHIIRNGRWSMLWLCSLVVLMVAVAACGGVSTTGGGSNASTPLNAQHNNQAQAKKSTAGGTQQYLIKTLNITMEVKDTQRVATDLQTWVSAADPLSTAESIQYEQVGDNAYNVTMTFSVQASLYPRIESYLNTYPAQHNGRLISTNKTTQDVTGDYVDTQSRLKNLRAEQSRLLTLLSHASVLGDILSIDQRLTDVEGQIEQIEAHLNQLNGQTTFYNITLSLQPSSAVVNPPPAAWSLGRIWLDALNAASAFGQVLLTVLVWLLVFSVYIVPLVVVVWLVRRWMRMRSGHPMPAVASTPASPQSGS